jgi:hypothetical protein
MHACMYVSMYLCTHAFMYVCMYVGVCGFLFYLQILPKFEFFDFLEEARVECAEFRAESSPKEKIRALQHTF